jgi:hypothetical protein
MSRSALIAALVAASVTSVSAVFAQPDPAAPPGPGPAAPPPPAAAAGSDAPPEAPAPLVKAEAGPSTGKDAVQSSPKEGEEETKSPIRGSTFLFDQSITTETAHIGQDQQTITPLYEWWISFRPRYYFNDHVYVSGRFDYYKELTNAGETDLYREDVFGDIWTDLGYTTPVKQISKNTKVTIAARRKWPTSKESQAMTTYVNAGVTGSVKQTIPINGESAKFLNEAHVALGAYYSHPFTRATTPEKESFERPRMDSEQHTFVSHQVRGSAITAHSLVTSIDTGLQVTPKLSLTLDMIFISGWKYGLKQGTSVATNTGAGPVPGAAPTDSRYGLATWFIASADYELFDELSLGLGYYNLASALSSDSQTRGLAGSANVWWSPDARVFFDVTANLDKIYDLASGRKKNAPPKTTAKASSVKLPSSFATQQGL